MSVTAANRQIRQAKALAELPAGSPLPSQKALVNAGRARPGPISELVPDDPTPAEAPEELESEDMATRKTPAKKADPTLASSQESVSEPQIDPLLAQNDSEEQTKRSQEYVEGHTCLWRAEAETLHADIARLNALVERLHADNVKKAEKIAELKKAKSTAPGQKVLHAGPAVSSRPFGGPIPKAGKK